jgi:hypothetical protein
MARTNHHGRDESEPLGLCKSEADSAHRHINTESIANRTVEMVYLGRDRIPPFMLSV